MPAIIVQPMEWFLGKSGYHSQPKQLRLYMMDTYTLPPEDGFVREMNGEPVGLFFIYSPDNRCVAAITNYGARLVSLLIPDASGIPVDVVLGYPSLETYLDMPNSYMGALLGRCAGPIAAGLFVLSGSTVILPVNDGPNTMNSGPGGLHTRIWHVSAASRSTLTLRCCSPEERNGFPGNLDAELVLEWTENNVLRFLYRASCDKPTLVNLASQIFFNLSGEGSETILDHELTLAAEAITTINPLKIPNGSLQTVIDTAFDFRGTRQLGAKIDEQEAQLLITGGYDHSFILRNCPSAARLFSPRTGISMSITTDRPAMQLCTGNTLNGGYTGKCGRPYHHRSGLLLQPQGFPDAIHHPQFPSVVLKPGEVFYSVAEYSFSS